MSGPVVRRAPAMPHGTPEVPVAIVGAGACGLAAALALRDAGVDCVLLERDAVPSGSTALSSGFIPAAGTRVQREAGVLDDVAQRFAEDIARKSSGRKSSGRAAPHLVAAYTRAIAPALDALVERHGLRLELLDGFVYPGHSRRRMHAVPERSGAALMAALLAAAESAGATLLCRARVSELWCDEQSRVLGLGVERPDGRTEHLACAQLLLACNGFGGNAAMVRELLPAMADAPFAGHAGNDGSAIAWGRALGAGLADLSACQGHGAWAVPQGALITWALMAEGGIQLNRRGERFHDESRGYSEASLEVLAQPGGIAWCVFDAPLLALARGFPDFAAAEAAGALREAAAARGLAAILGCEETVLAATIDSVDPRRADAFGRRFSRRLAPPYFAVRVTGALFHTQGGLDIDAQCRVRRADGAPFPNLHAAGGAARGVSGDSLAGYLSGNGLLSAVAGGFIAARSMAAALGHRPLEAP